MISDQVDGNQLVASVDHDGFSCPHANSQRQVAIEGEPLLVADGGQKEIQKDHVARKPDGKLAKKTPIDPRESILRPFLFGTRFASQN